MKVYKKRGWKEARKEGHGSSEDTDHGELVPYVLTADATEHSYIGPAELYTGGSNIQYIEHVGIGCEDVLDIS